MPYNPDTERPYVGFHMPRDLLADLDAARLHMRVSRSEFLRRAVRALVQNFALRETFGE
ncbi:CopG family ribbon-helix-helix protein [Bradyrhizobium yuanmingense]|uniref:CopG family ribbon-helix-helix protein n=1 Tax=Bradyrhizobium yuanmingense TaxID=108015 RepID=UPI0009F2B204